ncbi:hypothetical protein GO986_06945 [Deinococcus sp. HMF7620]|uniref:Uncharacterized protein n=1 Tax=Deinococcus arboris TaxID=2682977 RepID=A0A7C9LTA9_9DEIO|nr:hypothetical protein [Deinococcus arboris]MVN86500.1 hypothetical protein [Deinococcus arboris]
MPNASAVVSAAFQVHGRGWALELADLEGTVRKGDWVSGFPAPHDHRSLQVLGVECVDRELSTGSPQAAAAVVIAKLKGSLAQDIVGRQVSFSSTNPQVAASQENT